MAHRSHGLARHLKIFLATLAGAGPRAKARERDQLATELLKTLSPQVLAETGHWRSLAPAALAARDRDS